MNDLIPQSPPDFVPLDCEVRKAEHAISCFVALGNVIDDAFKKQLRILWAFYHQPRLLKAAGYDNLYEMASDPRIRPAIKIAVESPTQFYRLMDVAELISKPAARNLPFNEVEFISQLTRVKMRGQASLVSELVAYADNGASEEDLRRVWDERLGESNGDLREDHSPKITPFRLSEDGMAILRGSRVVIALSRGWWKKQQNVRIVSQVVEFESYPSVTEEDNNLSVWTEQDVSRLGEWTEKARSDDRDALLSRVRVRRIKNI